jgi:hypothetical protein
VSNRSSPLALGLVFVALLLACAYGPGNARVYDPLGTPRAKFVAPLAPYPNPSYRTKDFSLIKKGDWYHLFYTRTRRFSPSHYGSGASQLLNETTFGHAISRDLEIWFPLDTVLTVHPGTWDAHHVWAPHVVEKNGVTWMFYTGVRDSQYSAVAADWLPRWQTIGAAYSTDALLQTWTRVATPVWQPCATPWAVCQPMLDRGTADFRDPFVLPPPPGPNQPWLLYMTARPRADEYNYIVGVAQSTNGPGTAWSDVGPLWDVYTPTGNSKLESPHVLDHNGQWILFTTGDDGSSGILWNTALMPATGPWQSHGSISTMLSGKLDLPYPYTLEPEYWFASECLSENGPSTRSDYFCVVHAYDAPAVYNPVNGPPEDISIIEFRQMIWHANGTFDLAAPNPVRSISTPGVSLRVGDSASLTLGVEAGSGRVADLEVVRIENDVEFPVANTAVGLPATVTMPGNGNGALSVPWQVRGAGLALPALFEIRVANQPLRTSTRVTIQPGDGSADDPPVEMPVTRLLAPGRIASTPPPVIDPEPIGLRVRAIDSTPLSPGRGLLVEMPGAGQARIELYNVLGRRVRFLGERDLPKGPTIESWDARDDAGRPVPRGIYFARVTSAFGRANARFVVLD